MYKIISHQYNSFLRIMCSVRNSILTLKGSRFKFNMLKFFYLMLYGLYLEYQSSVPVCGLSSQCCESSYYYVILYEWCEIKHCNNEKKKRNRLKEREC